MRKLVLVCLVLEAMLAASAQASVVSDASGFLSGKTVLDFRDYENIYDPSGNIVTTGVATAGDTIQGVFFVNFITNNGKDNSGYNVNTLELTGVFDQLVGPNDAFGNQVLSPDNTTTTGSKALSGATFQSLYGPNAMLAIYATTGGSLTGESSLPVGVNTANAVAAWNLATNNSLTSQNSVNGSGTTNLMATFGANGSSPYYWAAQPDSQTGTTAYAASLGLLTNNTTIPYSQWALISQTPPGTIPPDAPLYGILNQLGLKGSAQITLDQNSNLVATGPYYETSTDPVTVSIIPEPSSIVIMSGLFGIFAWVASRRKSKA